MMSAEHKQPLMRCLGEFVGPIIRAIKSDSKTHELNRTVEENTDGHVTLRRTTIDEIEIRTEDRTRD